MGFAKKRCTTFAGSPYKGFSIWASISGSPIVEADYPFLCIQSPKDFPYTNIRTQTFQGFRRDPTSPMQVRVYGLGRGPKPSAGNISRVQGPSQVLFVYLDP